MPSKHSSDNEHSFDAPSDAGKGADTEEQLTRATEDQVEADRITGEGQAQDGDTHHHPGIASSSVLAVRYPGGARYDLALLEALLCVALIVWLSAMGRRLTAEGLVSGAMLIAVGGFRYASHGLRLDRAAAADGWEPTTALALSALGAAAILYGLLRRQGGTGERQSEVESMVA